MSEPTLVDSAQFTVQPRNWADPPVPKTTIGFDVTPQFDSSLQVLMATPILADSTMASADSARRVAVGRPHAFIGQYDQWQIDSVHNQPNRVLIPNCVFRLPPP